MPTLRRTDLLVLVMLPERLLHQESCLPTTLVGHLTNLHARC